MADKILARRDTAANWTSVNPVLALGEIGFETDTTKIKFGDGSTAWTSLGYASGSMSDAEVRTAVEAATDSNVFTDNDHTKLDAIEASADVTDASNVDTAGAVMDSDISDGEGFLRKTGAGAYEAIKTNLGAAVAPGVSDDNTADYAVGSRWIDTTADKEYVALDVSTGAAVWTETTGGGGGNSPTVINFRSAQDYTLVLTDAYKIIEMSSTNDRVLTIPLNSSVDFDVGVLINVVKILSGDVTVKGATGVNLNGTSAGSVLFTDKPFSGAALYQRSNDNWVINGAHGDVF